MYYSLMRACGRLHRKPAAEHHVGIFYECFKSPGRERRGGEVGLEETKRGDLVGVNEAQEKR